MSTTMTHHANHVILIGTALQTWSYGNDRGVRLQMRRPAFFPIRSDGPCDLVNVVLPEAVTRGQNVAEGDALHVTGFIRNAERETPLAAIARGLDLPDRLKKARVKQIVTEVIATEWQIIPAEKSAEAASTK
jgi:hypothetical protein